MFVYFGVEVGGGHTVFPVLPQNPTAMVLSRVILTVIHILCNNVYLHRSFRY